MRNARARFTGALLLAAAACGGADPVPTAPTWVDDVEPILRANCFGCHGAGWEQVKSGLRFDVYDVGDPGYKDVKDLGIDVAAFGGAKDNAPGFKNNLMNPDQKSRMPPPPALALGTREIDIITLWASKGAPRGTRMPNSKPTIKLLAAPMMTSKGLAVSVLVSDDDHDQVLGKLTLGGTANKPILRAGAQTIVFDNPPADRTLTATLFDGQETVTGIAVKE